MAIDWFSYGLQVRSYHAESYSRAREQFSNVERCGAEESVPTSQKLTWRPAVSPSPNALSLLLAGISLSLSLSNVDCIVIKVLNHILHGFGTSILS